MTRYTCDQLGVCMGDNPACQMCAIERETRRLAAEADQRDVWDRIAYWTAVIAVSVATVVTLCGIAGFAYGRLTQ
jgi:anti-sigma-K factor RskA